MSELKSTTLRPGLLVSLKTSVTGNVKYTSQTIMAEKSTKDGKRKKRWKTERTVNDPEEHERALQVRGRIRTLISGVCAWSAFGMLCPEDKVEILAGRIAEGQALAREFNATAKITAVSVYCLTGRIAPDDVQAVKAINSEVRELMTEMEEGLKALDIKRVREAAQKARDIGTMLPPATADRIQMAVDAARSTSRRMIKAGKAAARELDKATLRRIAEARTAFLDIDDNATVQAPSLEGRGIEIEDSEPELPIAQAPKAAARSVEVD